MKSRPLPAARRTSRALQARGAAALCASGRGALPLLRPVLLALGLLLLQVLHAPAAVAQLVIQGNDEYAELVFDIQLLDATGTLPPATAESSPPDSATATESAAPRTEELQSLRTIEASIDSALAANGLYSAELRERYQALGALQQQLGQHDSAVATFEKSVHIARVNDGLFTPDQEADIQRIIASLSALGDLEREADYRAYLYYMQRRAYAEGDPRLVAARLAWADWNLQTYQRSALLNPRIVQLPGSSVPEELVVVRNPQNGDVRFVPRRYVMNSAGLTGALNGTSRFALTPEMMVDARLREAREIYEEMLAATDPPLDAGLRESLRLKLVAGEYAYKRHVERLMDDADDGSVVAGATARVDPLALRRGLRESSELLDAEIVALEAANPPDLLALATASLRQADLHVAYGQRRTAETWYARVWSSLLQAGLDETAATAWLHPAPLVPVPDFVVHPYSRELFDIGVDDTLPYRGYIDASLSLTRDGNVRRTEITGASDETPQRVRRLLLAYLRNQKMRPPLDKGVPVTREDLKLRFHYGY